MKRALVALKAEVTEGTDSVPDGTNAMRVTDLSVNPFEGSELDLAYVKSTFGASPKLRIESYATCEFTIDFSGAGTAGTAPKWADALLACGFDQTLIASAVTGTAQSGGSTTTIKLAAGASATDGYYNGMTLTGTGGTNSGESGVIIGYNGTTKIATLDTTAGSSWDNTSQYSIAAAAIYEPTSTSVGSATIHFYLDGVRHILLGARGNVSFDVSSGGRPSMKFMFTGVKGTVADVANPSATFTGWQQPVPLLTANVRGLVSGKPMSGGASGVQVKSFTLDMANDVKHRQLIGSAGVVFSGRNPKGSIQIEATTITFKNWISEVEAITLNPFFIQAGTVAGNRWALFAPQAQLSNLKYSNDDNIAMMTMDVSPIESVGDDDVRIVVK